MPKNKVFGQAVGGLHSGLGLRQLNEGKFKNALTLLEN